MAKTVGSVDSSRVMIFECLAPDEPGPSSVMMCSYLERAALRAGMQPFKGCMPVATLVQSSGE
jgi:hypothetical protein